MGWGGGVIGGEGVTLHKELRTCVNPVNWQGFGELGGEGGGMGGGGGWREEVGVIRGEEQHAGNLTLNVLYHTIPHELCRCEVKDVHSLQSYVFDTFWRKWQSAFHPLFAITNALNIWIFKTEFSHFFRGVGLGVESVHHCHQEVKS